MCSLFIYLFFPHVCLTFLTCSIQIKDMTKELDTLLQSIEQPGGYRDACTVSLESSVVALEQGIGTLSDKCRVWKVMPCAKF